MAVCGAGGVGAPGLREDLREAGVVAAAGQTQTRLSSPSGELDVTEKPQILRYKYYVTLRKY